MGYQYPLTLGKDEFALDILFYNTILHCYVVVDLKTKKFIPEYAGKMNFYLSLVGEKLKTFRPFAKNPPIAPDKANSRNPKYQKTSVGFSDKCSVEGTKKTVKITPWKHIKRVVHEELTVPKRKKG